MSGPASGRGRPPLPWRVRVPGLLALAAGEVALAVGYATRGTGWHFLLHSIVGAAAGLVVATGLTLARRRPGVPLAWAVAGQVLSDGPDLLFQLGRVPHRRWMDLAVAHIEIHLVAQPLVTAVAAFLLASAGWWLAAHTSRRGAGGLLAGLAVTVVVAALVGARPLPVRLSDYDPAVVAWCGPQPP